MNRLTQRDKNNNLYIDLLESENNVIYKLGALEDIEEKLGIDLITLFKALRGFYIKCGDEIHYCEETYTDEKESLVFLRNLGYDVEICYVPIVDGKMGIFVERSTRDYGKTWALTKEELE